MKLLSSVCVLASLLFINNAEARWIPKQGTTWNDVLADKNFDVTKEVADVIEVDYETSAEKIEYYHSYGKKVICYFSGGTIESWRRDYDKYLAVPGLVRNTYSIWDDERWLDYRVDGYKELVISRIQVAIDNKCDAIEVDNMDGYQIKDVKQWSNPLTPEDTVKYAKWLAQTAHELGISIGLKNIAGLLPQVGEYFDFAVNESCVNYKNECSLYKDFVSSGKAVFAITYGDVNDKLETMCRELNGLGFSMIMKKTQNLLQDGIIWDGEKLCGSGFSNGYRSGSSSSSSSSSSVREVPKESTTSYKPTTTSYKPTTTKKTTTTTKKTTSTTKTYTTKKATTKSYYTTKKTTRKVITTVKPTYRTTKKVITKTAKAKKVIIVVKTVTRRRKNY